VLLAVTLAVVLVAVVVVVHQRRSSSGARARQTAQAYLSDWAAGRYADMAALADQPAAPFTRLYQDSARGLHEDHASYHLTSVSTGSRPSAGFTAQVTIAGYPTWTYTGTLPLLRRGKSWTVDWTPAALHPALRPGDRLGLVTAPPMYGHVVDRNGRSISAADAQLAQTVVGRAPSDPAGNGSSPGALHVRLADTLDGRAEATVAVLDTAGHVASRLMSYPAIPGHDVPTTLDLGLQKIAESAIAGSGKPASIVAVDTRTDAVIAAAGNPAAGPQAALTGRFPPGSTFKIVTATAALENGFTLSTPVQCPPTVSAGGVTFHNANNEALGTISFEKAFAMSCNTAFVGIAEALPPGALARAAAFYGCTAEPGGAPTPDPLPIPSFTCNFPPVSGGEYAASAFGQAQVEVSPLGMTTITAAAATGTWQAPRLVPSGPLAPTTTPRSLPANVVSDLHTVMRAVVTSGTATSIANTAVAGKTGTAEYGTANPPLTHAWFTGYLGHYAVTVLVQNGGFGGDAAAPLAARFLTSAQAAP
jgi:hypothetical protein